MSITMAPAAPAGTDNVPPARTGGDTFTSDPALVEAVRREAGNWALPGCSELGQRCAEPDTIALGFAANEHPPVHRPYDRDGRRVDATEFHPAWHELMALAARHGIMGAPWVDDRAGAHAARAAKFLTIAQVEAGITCPIAMTYSCVPALRLDPALAEVWEPLVTSPDYDPRELPAPSKTGAIEEGAAGDRDAAAFRRIAAPILKYWVCKRAPYHAAEALECQGGGGYMEDSRLPRAYREAPLMSIWEGSGNIQALDVIRALVNEEGVSDALLAELRLAGGANRLLDSATTAVADRLSGGAPDEGQARAFVSLAARALQASLLVRFAPPAVADGFCASRLAPRYSGCFGDLPPGIDSTALVERALPDAGRPEVAE